jgi:hypothetical protein
MRNPTKNREVLSRKLDNINNFTYFLMHDLRYICIYLYIWIKTFDKVELKLKALFRFKYNFILNEVLFLVWFPIDLIVGESGLSAGILFT